MKNYFYNILVIYLQLLTLTIPDSSYYSMSLWDYLRSHVFLVLVESKSLGLSHELIIDFFTLLGAGQPDSKLGLELWHLSTKLKLISHSLQISNDLVI